MTHLLTALICIATSFSIFAEVPKTEKELSQEYLQKISKEPNTVEIEDGIYLRTVFQSDNEETPTSDSTVVVMYAGYDRAGEKFDSSWDFWTPATLPLTKLITCWQKAMVQMTVGSAYKLTCSSESAYGESGVPPMIKPNAAISFDISLLKIQE